MIPFLSMFFRSAADASLSAAVLVQYNYKAFSNRKLKFYWASQYVINEQLQALKLNKTTLYFSLSFLVKLMYWFKILLACWNELSLWEHLQGRSKEVTVPAALCQSKDTQLWSYGKYSLKNLLKGSKQHFFKQRYC